MLDEEPLAVWAADPERIDPDDYSPGTPLVRQMTWAPCPDCRVQVHLPVVQFVYRGLVCPRCGREILPPPEGSEEWVRRVLREEDELSEQL